jgi:hypothetical protein
VVGDEDWEDPSSYKRFVMIASYVSVLGISFPRFQISSTCFARCNLASRIRQGYKPHALENAMF